MSEHVHQQRYDGDDPYLICSCGKRWDALTGKEIVTTSTPTPQDEVYSSQEWQIEKGVRKIVDLCTQTIIVDDAGRKARVEEAVRGIIKAYGDQRELEALDQLSQTTFNAIMSEKDAHAAIEDYIAERKRALKAKKEGK